MKDCKVSLFVVIGSLVLLSFRVTAGPEVELLVVTGQLAPGAPEGSVFTEFYVPALDQDGRVVFMADYGGPEGSGRGIWLHDPSGTITPIARSGAPVEGLDSSVSWSSDFYFSYGIRGGHVWLGGVVDGPNVNLETSRVLMTYSHGVGHGLLARSGMQAPGAPDGAIFWRSFLSTSTIAMNNAGMLALQTRMQTSSPTSGGVWKMEPGGEVEVFAISGQPLPGMPPGTFFTQDISMGSMTDDGGITLRIDLDGDGVTNSTDSGVWTQATPGGVGVLVVREGDMLPDGDIVEDLGSRDRFQIDESGLGVLEKYDACYLYKPDTGFQLLFREGDPAPGFGPGVTIRSVQFEPSIVGGLGLVELRLYRPGYVSPNDRALYLFDRDRDLTLLSAPDMPLGDTGLIWNSVYSGGYRSQSQHIVGYASVRNPADPGDFVSGYWHRDPSGVFSRIAGPRDVLDVDPSPGEALLREVGQIGVSGGSDDGPRAQINVHNQFVTGMTFEEGGEAIALYSFGSPCIFSDCTNDERLDLEDLDCFASAFLASEYTIADCVPDGVLNFDDLDAFVAAFLAGCP